METPEILLLMKYLNHSFHYLEFGLGGSTCLACNFKNIKKLYSVEASEKWIHKLKKISTIAKYVAQQTLTINYVDINGEDDNWSYPKDHSKQYNWTYYYNPWSKISLLPEPFVPDFILIDGRFRVACVLNCIYNLAEKTQPLIAIHDYPLRPHYHIVEQFLDVVEYSYTLYIFKIKLDVDLHKVKQAMSKYENDTR
jgi:hypothetical protein